MLGGCYGMMVYRGSCVQMINVGLVVCAAFLAGDWRGRDSTTDLVLAPFWIWLVSICLDGGLVVGGEQERV